MGALLIGVSCLAFSGGQGESSGSTVTQTKIVAMLDVIISPEMGLEQWIDEYERITGIDLEVVKPPHQQYYEKVQLAFSSGDMPDTVEIDSTHLQQYASDGALIELSAFIKNSAVMQKIGKEYRQQVLRDTAMYYLSYEQKRLVEEQVRSIAIEEMRKQNFFSRVEPLADGAPIKEGDYVLEIRPLRKITPQEIRGRVFYGAEMIAAVTRETVMRDGPLPAFYFGVRWGGSRTGQDASMRPDCRFYRMPVYIVETSDVAYVSEERLRERLRRTGDKSGVAVRAHRQGKPLRLTDECCYCQ